MEMPTELNGDQRRMLNELVAIPSWYSNDPKFFPERRDERAVLEKIEEYFKDTNCSVRRVPCDTYPVRCLVARKKKEILTSLPLQPTTIYRPYVDALSNELNAFVKKLGQMGLSWTVERNEQEDKGRWSLVVEKGTGDFVVLLYVHVDTVEPAEHWKNPYKVVEAGDTLSGLGAYDMKAGVMAIIDVMRTCKVPKGMKLIAACCPDEENNSDGALSLMKWFPFWDVDLILSPEIATIQERQECDHPKDVIVARRGHAKFLVKTDVPQVHAYGKDVPQAEAADAEIRNHLLQHFYAHPAKHPHFGDLTNEELHMPEAHVPRSKGYSNTTRARRWWSHLILPPNSVRAAIQTHADSIQRLADMKDWSRWHIHFSVIKDPQYTSYEPYIVNVSSAVSRAVLEGVTEYYGGHKLKGGSSTSDGNVFVPWFQEIGRDVPMFEVGPVGGGAHENREYVSASSIAKNIGWYRYMIEKKLPDFLALRR